METDDTQVLPDLPASQGPPGTGAQPQVPQQQMPPQLPEEPPPPSHGTPPWLIAVLVGLVALLLLGAFAGVVLSRRRAALDERLAEIDERIEAAQDRSSVATMPRPKSCAQIRFAVTRAV